MANGRNCGTAKCAHCGNEFRKPSNGAKYCSKQCADDALREARKIRRRKYNEVQMAPRVCPTCGNTFKPHKVKQMYCCGYCAVKAKRAAELAARRMKKTCPTCGLEFETTRGDRIFCSDKCAKKHSARKRYGATHKGWTPGRPGRKKSGGKPEIPSFSDKKPQSGPITESQRAQVLSDMSLPPKQRFKKSGMWTPAMHSYAKSIWKTRYDRCSSFGSSIG